MGAPTITGGGGGGGGTVTSVALTAPADLTVSGSPVTGSGTLAITRATQAANLALMGPASGAAATPTYRALVAADLPGQAVQSISLTTPNITYTSPITFSVSGGAATGTLALINQAANVVFAGPASGGAASPTWRALVAADVPNLAATILTSGTLADARLSSNVPLLNAANTFTAAQTINQPTSGGTILQLTTGAGNTTALQPLRVYSILNGSNYEAVMEAPAALRIGAAGQGTYARIVVASGNVFYQCTNAPGTVYFTGPNASTIAAVQFTATATTFTGSLTVNAGETVKTGADGTVGLIVQGNSTSQSADLRQIQSSAGAVLFAEDKRGRPYTGGTTPTFTVAGTGAGTSPTLSVAGTDVNGVLTITTGTGPTASAIVGTLTFSAAYAAAPKTVILTPADGGGGNATVLTGQGAVGVASSSITTTKFDLTVGTTALAASTTYKWFYQVLG